MSFPTMVRARRLSHERELEGKRGSAKDLHDRSMQSCWKTTLFHRLGGDLWCSLLIHLGTVNLPAVEILLGRGG